MIGLENVIAVVTGAAGGIGRAVVRQMKDAGAVVVATDLA
jgi:NADP-dependent 3-hydroxy acid dehydrogenase YdfG